MTFFRSGNVIGWALLIIAVTGVFYFLIGQSQNRWLKDDAQVFPLGPKDFQQMEIDYWKAIRVDKMTPEQIIDYLKWSNWTACEYRHYFGGVMQYWDPTGMDGQYPVCLDKPVRPITSKQKRCVVYSFGISNEWSFDEAMVEYGCDVFAFDPSMHTKNHNHSDHIQFYNLGLGPANYVDSNNWKLMTLDSIYRMLVPRHGETVIDYLKIDIEWDEWDALAQIIKEGTLSKVRQLTVEFHLPIENHSTDGQDSHPSEDYRALVGIVKTIEDRMIRFESRINPWCTNTIKSLNNYHGSTCFELSFYQTLPQTVTL